MITIQKATEKDLTDLAKVLVTAYNSLNIGEHWSTITAHAYLLDFFKKQSDLFL
jgi:hypothetical protein